MVRIVKIQRCRSRTPPLGWTEVWYRPTFSDVAGYVLHKQRGNRRRIFWTNRFPDHNFNGVYWLDSVAADIVTAVKVYSHEHFPLLKHVAVYWVVFGCVLLLLTRNWKPSRMASSCTNAADFAGKLSISSSVKIPLRRFRSFFDGKGGSVCEFWGSIYALREWPVWNLNRLHLWKSSWVGVQLAKGWQCNFSFVWCHLQVKFPREAIFKFLFNCPLI